MAQPIARGTPAALCPIVVMWTFIGEEAEGVLEYSKSWHAVQAMVRPVSLSSCT